jgi:hypothetical protein
MTDRVTYCDVFECCEECPRYGDDCDGRGEDEQTIRHIENNTKESDLVYRPSAEASQNLTKPNKELKGSDLISRADAIEAVANAIWHYPNECYYNLNDFDMAEALAKDAIKALPSAEAKGDLISRQDAVNTIKRYKHRLEGKGQTYGLLLEEFEHQIPSADAKTKCIAQIKVDTEEIVRRIKEEYDITDGWIPCSKRLPKKGEVVLITNGKGNVRCGQYRSEYDVRDGTHYWWWKGKTIESVLAWMPLPKPYREDGE